MLLFFVGIFLYQRPLTLYCGGRMRDSTELIENAKMMFMADAIMTDMARVFKDDLEERDEVGGFFSLIDPEFCETQSSFTFGVGEVSDDKVSKYREYSSEKPLRALQLGKSNSFIAGRDPEKGLWGGGFWITILECEGFGIGFSGLPENLDAVCCMLLLTRLRMLTLEQATQLISECGVAKLNEQWQKAVDNNLH